MSSLLATAVAHPNIAFIKYWGNRSEDLRLPVNGSISMNMDGLITRTTVHFDAGYEKDRLAINEIQVDGKGLDRVVKILEIVRAAAGISLKASVSSTNNFPTGAGIASSAAAFAALAQASVTALGLDWSEAKVSRLARLGSGSASRSVPGGFVEWYLGDSDEASYAETIAPKEHWSLVDCVAIVSSSHKKTGSTEGHVLASTSPLQIARVVDTPRRISLCRQAILEKDMSKLASILQLDSDMMHSVMMTSTPALFYWQPETMSVMKKVQQWRDEGLQAGYTIDAGPNVHVICEAKKADEVAKLLKKIPGVQKILVSPVGDGVRIEG